MPKLASRYSGWSISSWDTSHPGAVGSTEPQETGSLGQGRKQAPPIATHPPIERLGADAFEGKEYAQGNNLAGPQSSLMMLRLPLQGLIYLDGAYGC